MKHKLYLIAISFLIILPTIGLAQNLQIKSVNDDVVIESNIKYVSYKTRDLLLDLYRPLERKSEKLPVILVIRGGGWYKGDKEGFEHIASSIAHYGFITVCIEYRPSGEALFPAAILDTKAAVKWIKDNAENYGMDASHVGVIGGSAGAYLALFIGVTDNVSSLNTDNSVDYKVNAVVCLAPPVDLRNYNLKSFSAWLGKDKSQNIELRSFASPITHIDVGSAPLLTLHGVNDSIVPFEQSVAAVKQYEKKGAIAEMYLLSDAPHGFWNTEKYFQMTIARAVDFFNKHLK